MHLGIGLTRLDALAAFLRASRPSHGPMLYGPEKRSGRATLAGHHAHSLAVHTVGFPQSKGRRADPRGPVAFHSFIHELLLTLFVLGRDAAWAPLSCCVC